MNRDEAMNVLRKSINILLGKQKDVEIKLMDVQTKDGKTLSTPSDKLEIGAVLYSIDDQGNQIPVEDGSYELEDGSTIEIKESVITEIANSMEESKEDELADEAKPEAEDKSKEAPKDEAPKDGDTESRISKLESEVAELMSMLQSMTENSTELTSKVEEFASQPAGNAIKNKVVIEKQLSPDELRTQRFMSIKNSLKNN